MKCEEFEAMGLDSDRDGSVSEAERAAAREHVSSCARCAALQVSWQATRVELRVLAEETATAEAPARVEMRLRQEFRTRHHNMKARRTAVAAAWALAAAAVLIGAVGWVKWRDSQQIAREDPAPARGVTPALNTAPNEFGADDNSVTLVADKQPSNFTLLPGIVPGDIEDASILRVSMQRGALGAFGLPVNEDLAGEWIQVDLLVGDDGSPEAVRLLPSQ